MPGATATADHGVSVRDGPAGPAARPAAGEAGRFRPARTSVIVPLAGSAKTVPGRPARELARPAVPAQIAARNGDRMAAGS